MWARALVQSVILMFYVRGFDWRFFSMRADHDFTRSFQTAVKPKSKTAVYELAAPTAAGTRRIDRPQDRPAIIHTLDAFVQQAVVQKANAKRFVSEFGPWFDRWLAANNHEKGAAAPPAISK